MKNIITAGLMLASLNAFSQSYLILHNGVTLTTDKAGFVYDFGHFRIPYRVTVNGGQFHVEDKKLSTVDSAGFLYEKDLKVDKIRGKGLNYFINDDSDLFTVDEQGFYYKFDKESKIFKRAFRFGGNFFLVQPHPKKPLVELYTINSKGNYFKVDVNGLNPASVTSVGGTYFQTTEGITYTVSKDGFVFAKPEVQTGAVKVSGGNFFVDSKNLLFTVSEDGFLMLPILPANLKISEIQNVGANYMLDSKGRMFVVDSAGNIAERSTKHDLLNAKILSL